MSEIVLTGLRADLPIGAMAAFGLLRVCEQSLQLSEAKLHWISQGGGYCAVLSTGEAVSGEDLVSALVGNMKNAANRPEFLWAEQIKSATKGMFIAGATARLDAATAEAHAEADWFPAFACELLTDKEDQLRPTPLDMTVSHQKFLTEAVKLAKSLSGDVSKRKPVADSYREALFGPWRYEDNQHSLGWDPSTMRLGAYTSKAPTNMPNAGVRTAVWLALESLPLFPNFCVEGRLRTRGFVYGKRTVEFSWPVWVTPITVHTLKSLLSLPALMRDPVAVEELAARGIVAVFRSRRAKPNKYLASFQPAVLCVGGIDDRGI